MKERYRALIIVLFFFSSFGLVIANKEIKLEKDIIFPGELYLYG